MSINNDPIATEFSSEPSKNAQSLQTLASGPLSSSLSSLFSAFQTLPSHQDFPVYQIVKLSDSLLDSIGSSAKTWCPDKSITFPSDIDSVADNEAYDWLVNINNVMMKQFDVSIDEFQNSRKRHEETGRCLVSEPDINGLAYLKKKQKGDGGLTSNSVGESVSGKEGGFSSYTGVKVKKCASAAEKKEKIPFHIPTIRKPQQEYKIVVDNSNQPFEHVWLQKSEDGQRFVHPLENLSVIDFVDKDVADIEPLKPPPIESTPFMLVEEEKDLKELAAKLQSVNEFAVDLEHNQYRSFQGLTCLMQISTRTEDFIVDTLKLRSHVGPYLREVFKDPTKKKVLHGADRDIVWLQRDFGIYICNLFDTGQASRVLKMERNSLEHLLQHFCGVTANKQYQNADWRLRPLTAELLRYGREDTHYLLYIYDLMRVKLLSMPTEPEHCDTPLVEVYKRSSEVCMQLYEKELLTENSYLHIHGVQAAGFNANQLAIAAGLCEWRDPIARSEDESTGYILPNKVLLDIAKQMPLTSDKLRRLLKSKFPYLERNIGAVVSIIKRSIQNSAKFEAAAQQLKIARALHEERKLEQIRSSANPSSHPCLGTEEPTRVSQISPPEEPSTVVATDSDEDEPYGGGGGGSPETANADSPVCHVSGRNKGNDEETVSLSDQSASFEQCTWSFKAEKSEGRSSPLQLKPFDYEAALRQVFPAPGNRTATKSKKQSRPLPLKPFDYEAAIQQVFPASVNNSATKPKGQSSSLQVKPFDHEAASGSKSATKSKGQSSPRKLKPFDYEAALRQVFPRSGNRSATLR